MASTCVQVGGGYAEMLLKGFAFAGQVAESLADAFAGQRGIGREVKQVVFHRLERDEPVFKLCPTQMFCLSFISQGHLELFADAANKVRTQLHFPVVFLDGGSDVVDVCEGRIAGPILHAAAEEVPVLAAMPADAALLDEAPVDVAFETAVPAPEAALEIVSVATTPFPRHSSCIEDALDEIKEVGLDQRGMTALKGFAFVGHFAEVVAISARRARAYRNPSSCSA